MANTNTEIIAMLETNPSQAIRGVLDTLYLYNPATVNDLIEKLNEVIAQGGFEAIVVDALPETGKKGTIYFVPSGGETPNIYNEYVWVTETEKFEMIGSAQVDLSNYYTKEEIDNALKGLDPLPDQTDNAGKFLMTDGTTASWSDTPLVNKATDKTSIAVLGTSSGLYSIALGDRCSATSNFTVNIGYNVSGNGVGIGQAVSVKSNYPGKGVAIGGSVSATNGVCIGENAEADNGIIISCGYNATKHKATPNCFHIGTPNGNFEIMSADGTIPTDRYTTTPTTAGTYVPKLTIAEDGTATREWGTELGGAGGGTSVTIRNWA